MTPVTARCDGSTIGAKAGIRGCSAAAGPVKIRSAALTKGCTLSCTCVSTRKLLRSARGRVRGLASPARQRISACAHKALQSAASHQSTHVCETAITALLLSMAHPATYDTRETDTWKKIFPIFNFFHLRRRVMLINVRLQMLA